MTPKEQVLKEYPKAVCRPVYYPDSGDWFVILNGNQELGFSRYASDAWADAAGKLKTDKSITHATSN